MLTVTDSAKELLGSFDHPTGTALRLEVQEGTNKLSLMTGGAAADDQVIEKSGTEVLRVASSVATLLDGATMDVAQTPEGPRLNVRTPSESAG